MITAKGFRSFTARRTIEAIVTLTLLFGSWLVILMPGYPDSTQKFAFGVLGTLMGFWLPIKKDSRSR